MSIPSYQRTGKKTSKGDVYRDTVSGATKEAKDVLFNATTGLYHMTGAGRPTSEFTDTIVRIKHDSSKGYKENQLNTRQGEQFGRIVPKLLSRDYSIRIKNIYKNILKIEGNDRDKFRKMKEFINDIDNVLDTNDSSLPKEAREHLVKRYSEFAKAPKSDEFEKMKKAQPELFGGGSSSSSSSKPPLTQDEMTQKDMLDTINKLTEKYKDFTSESKSRSAEHSAKTTPAGSRGASQPRGVSEEKKTDAGLGTLDLSGLSVLPEDDDSEDDTGDVTEYRDDPLITAPLQDLGGAVQSTFNKTLKKPKITPSAPPSNQFLDSDIPQDMRNQRAIDFNRYLGGNPYKIQNDVMEQADEQERLATANEYDHYLSEIANMTRNASIFHGADNVAGEKKGTEDDVKYGGDEQKAPASFNPSNPQGMRDQMKPKQPRDGSLDPMGGTPADNNVDRTLQNSGVNLFGLTPQEQNDYRSGRGLPAGFLDNIQRLSDRSLVNSRANQLNSEGAGGSGIASEIASYVDLADAGNIGSRYGQRQSNGADDNSSFTTDDPRTLNDRFSDMGMRRQGQKIDKYVNMKNKGMMYSNLMGKGVSDPSIQSIRDRKDDYIQPNGKHKGNSVNLIRQSNATSIRLNNMYMP